MRISKRGYRLVLVDRWWGGVCVVLGVIGDGIFGVEVMFFNVGYWWFCFF